MNLFGFLKKNKNYYDHIISLGYNCEVSFQFFKKYGFVESSLFAWVNTLNIENIIYAINHLDKIGSGKLENINPMWKCFNTNISFHGKAPMDMWANNPTKEMIENDKCELLQRIAYLKNKFLNTGMDGKNNLYIFKYPSNNYTQKHVINEINKLFSSLRKIVTNNFDLLIILEKTFYPDIKIDNKNIIVRRVDFFTPEDDVTTKNNDKKHWRKIFSEFRPNFKLKKSKKFKFEEID